MATYSRVLRLILIVPDTQSRLTKSGSGKQYVSEHVVRSSEKINTNAGKTILISHDVMLVDSSW